MIKIKFNMDFHGEYIRNLEDLRKNFSVEDILEAYDNGLLVRWLDARYYTKELKQVQAIEAKNARGVLEELIRIFCPETEQEEIDANLSLYDYLEGLRKFRDYITTNGLYELGTIRQERDKLTQELANIKNERDSLNDENAKLKTELAALRKENDNLKPKAERQNQSSSSVIEAKISASLTFWQTIHEGGTQCIIKRIGNCSGKLQVKSAGKTSDVYTIEDAFRKDIKFDGLAVRGRTLQFYVDLYFNYEVL